MEGGANRPEQSGSAPMLRGARPEEIATILRAVMGLPPEQSAREELTAKLGEPLPCEVHVDAGAWIAWCLIGLPLFGDRLPTLRQARMAASRIAIGLAMLHTRGNLTRAVAVLMTSRKTLREDLRRLGLYPWRSPTTTGPDQTEPRS